MDWISMIWCMQITKFYAFVRNKNMIFKQICTALVFKVFQQLFLLCYIYVCSCSEYDDDNNDD